MRLADPGSPGEAVANARGVLDQVTRFIDGLHAARKPGGPSVQRESPSPHGARTRA